MCSKGSKEFRMAYLAHSSAWVSFWKISTCLYVKLHFTYARQVYLDNQCTLSIYNVTESGFLSTIHQPGAENKS